MSNQCFKIVRGTKFDRAIKKHFEQREDWKYIFNGVSELLGEKVERMAFEPNNLVLAVDDLEKEENKKLFKKDGQIKQNSKAAKRLLEQYKELVKRSGLEDFKELRYINFAYGVIRNSRYQKLENFVTSENDTYYKANFDLAKKTNGLVEQISEVEYEEKYLEELKKRDAS